MLPLILALLAASPLFAEEWQECRSGPFEIWTNGSENKARELLVRLEQMRHVLGTLLGKPDPVSLWTIRVIAPKRGTAAPWTLGRDAWISQLPEGQPVTRAWQREVAGMLLQSNAKRLPAEWENGLLDLLSNLEAIGPKITLGAPLEPAARTRDWVRVQYLATREEYTTRWRVLLNNLQNGADEDVAFRNSIGKTRAQLETEIDPYAAAGQFTPLAFAGRPIAAKDFSMRPLDPPRVTGALADATGNPKLPPAGTLESFESLGLAGAGSPTQQEAARDFLKQAIANQSKSARVHLAYGLLLDAPEAKRAAYVEAAKLNPRWAQPYVELANLERTGERVAFYLKTAASLEPRNSALWQRLGRSQLEASQYSDASKSFYNAMLAAPTPAEKEAINRIRREFEEERAEKEAADRRRIADEKQRELDRLKNEALNQIRLAEAKANQGRTSDSGAKVEQWWDDKQPSQKITGTLEKVDCVGKAARVWIKPPTGKTLALLIRNPSQIVIIGGGETAFTCGPQKPPKRAAVEFKPRSDPKFATAGDVAVLEFQ